MISEKDYDEIYQKGYEDGKNDNITKIEYALKPSFTTRKLKEQQNEIERLNKEKSILEKSLKLMWKKDIKIDYEELDKANKVVEEVLKADKIQEVYLSDADNKAIANQVKNLIVDYKENIFDYYDEKEGK